jgi:hypothetical protein
MVDADDLQRSARPWLLLAADCRRIKRDEIARSIEGPDSLPLLVDLDFCGIRRFRVCCSDVGYYNGDARPVKAR